MIAVRSLRHALVLLTASLALATVGCEETPPARAPQQPFGPPGMQALPPQTPFGMSDAPSYRPEEMPTDSAPRAAMNGAAAAVYQQALAAFAAGDLEQARTLFRQTVQADPRAYQAYYSLGTVEERLRDANAAASYKQAFTIVPDYEPAIVAYGLLAARKGNLNDADRFLAEKRGQMPKSAAVAAALAEVKSLQRDTGSAQRIAQEALKLNPDYRPAMVTIARDHYRNRRLDLALYALQAILDGFEPVDENPPRDKDNPEALLLRGLILREQGQRSGAMTQFRAAVAKRPDLVEARVQLGTMLMEAGNAEEALPLLEGAMRYDSDNVPARLALGDAYRLGTRYADAKREFEWVVGREPNLAEVHYNLGLLYLFAPSIPNMPPKDQIAAATKELKRFQELRSKGESDDSDELLNRAKLKEAELNAASAAAEPMPPPAEPAPPADGAPPKDAPPSDAAPQGTEGQ